MPTSITLPDSGHRSHAHPPMKWCHVLSTRRVEREPSWATVKFAGMKLKFLALWERTDGLTELSDADVSRKHAPLTDIFALAFWWVFYYCCHSLCGTYCAMRKIIAKIRANTASQLGVAISWQRKWKNCSKSTSTKWNVIEYVDQQACDVSPGVLPRTKRYHPFWIFICIVYHVLFPIRYIIRSAQQDSAFKMTHILANSINIWLR